MPLKSAALRWLIVVASLAGTAIPGARAAEFTVASDPGSASVFHYFRGRYYFLGETPLRLTPEILENKAATELLVSRFGYQSKRFDIDVDGVDKVFELEASPARRIVAEDGHSIRSTECKDEADKIVNSLVADFRPKIFDVSLPLRWVETADGPRIVVIVNLLNRDDIVELKKIGRQDRDAVLNSVEALADPVSRVLVERFGRVDCLSTLLLVVNYKDKGLRLDFSPYRQYWSASTRYTVGNITYVQSAWGSTIELRKDMKLSSKEKSFFFEYSLD